MSVNLNPVFDGSGNGVQGGGPNFTVLKTLHLDERSAEVIQTSGLLAGSGRRFPPNAYTPSTGDFTDYLGTVESASSGYTNRLSIGPDPKIPKPKLSSEFDAGRHQLPIYKYKKSLLKTVEDYKICFIKGDPGCGKTTQVPQFILDDATLHKKEVRILCTAPRRIAAVSNCDRVATERGEKVGYTVGYQLRLESCFSPVDTILTYCTSAVLLRSLESLEYEILNHVTHIIIDEVHERDRLTDFLIACIRDVGLHFPKLRIILMGADMDCQLLTNYFGGPKCCPLIEVKGRVHPVKVYFLEDVLQLVDYTSPKMLNNESVVFQHGLPQAPFQNNYPVDSNGFMIMNPILQRLLAYEASLEEGGIDLSLILMLIHKIIKITDMSQAILVFLPDYEEIAALKKMMFTDPMMYDLVDSLVVFLLHPNIQTGDQKAAFERPREGLRKVILSTSIAETSLTVEDVVFVIDTGRANENWYDGNTGVTELKSSWISKGNANQRQGRAGRCSPGTCYRLYSSATYRLMEEFKTPEILRSSLQELCLYTRAFIRENLHVMDFLTRLPEPPSAIAIKRAVDLLITMGAFDVYEQLTELGIYLMDFPIEPSLAKALVYAIVMKCLDPILTIIAVVSYRDPFQFPSDPFEKRKAQESKLRFSSDSMSDHMAILKAFQDWEKSKLYREATENRFCNEHYLSAACFEMIYGIRSQLLGQLRACGFVKSKGAGDLHDLNINSDNWGLVKGIMTDTLYPNICAIAQQRMCLYNESESTIFFDPSSTVILNRPGGYQGIPMDWVLYEKMTREGDLLMIRGCTCVGDVAVALFAGNCTIVPTVKVLVDGSTPGFMRGSERWMSLQQPRVCMEVNQWITFQGDRRTIQSMVELRQQLHELMLKKLKNPFYRYSVKDDVLLHTIALILTLEDRKIGLTPVKGIGQWPKLVSGNMMSAPRAGYERSQAAVLEDSDEGEQLYGFDLLTLKTAVP